MTAQFKRVDRIAEAIQRTLARVIQREIHDPRLSGVITLSAVRVSKDLSHAKVYFTVYGADQSVAESVLNAAAPYLRSVLAKALTTRTIPQLHFVYDASIEYANRLGRLIDDANLSEGTEDEQAPE